MKEENAKALDNLARTSYRSGVFIVFLGVLVMFVHIVNQEYTSVLIGLLIFIMGYGFTKIAAKIQGVIRSDAQ